MHWSRFAPKLVQLPNTNYPGGTTHLTGQDVWLTDTKIDTKTATEQNWQHYKYVKRFHQRQCRKAKRDNWKGFISDSYTQKSASLLSKIVQRKINTNSIGHMKLANGSLATDTKYILKTLVDERFPATLPRILPLPPEQPNCTLSHGKLTN